VAARPNQGSARGPSQHAASTAPDPNQENYYQLLGVPYTATAAEITASYRQSMKRFHPDRVRPEHRAAAENLTKDINRAYRTLSNPTERLAYDRSIRPTEVQDQIMQRYVGGFGGPGMGGQDPYGSRLKRDITSAERKDHRRSERSAVITLLSVFLVVALGAIGLILLGGLVSFAIEQVF
jgi:DnaJ-class molecular chaperone